MSTRKVKTARIKCENENSQYWQGHGISFTHYDECATGCGSTVSDAFEDALEQLAQQSIELTDEQENELRVTLADEFGIEAIEERDDWYFYVSIDAQTV